MQALAAGDYAGFMARESRGAAPGPLAAVRAAGGADRQRRHGRGGGRAGPRAGPGGAVAPGVVVLGPAPAPLAMLRGRHRRRLLLKARRDVAVQPILREWVAQVTPKGGARVDVDVDPMSFL